MTSCARTAASRRCRSAASGLADIFSEANGAFENGPERTNDEEAVAWSKFLINLLPSPTPAIIRASKSQFSDYTTVPRHFEEETPFATLSLAGIAKQSQAFLPFIGNSSPRRTLCTLCVGIDTAVPESGAAQGRTTAPVHRFSTACPHFCRRNPESGPGQPGARASASLSVQRRSATRSAASGAKTGDASVSSTITLAKTSGFGMC